jgi:hypothetical protein
VSKNRPPKSKYSQNQIEEALAGIIASTKRVRRKLNLLEIAKKVKIGREALGGLKKLSDAVGISEEMLRQFSTVEKLTPAVKNLIAKNIIQGIDVADRLSRLPSQNQLAVAKEVAKGGLTSDDVRAIVSLRKALPDLNIDDVIARIKASRNIKHYIVEFLLPPKTGKSDIESRFMKLLGKESFLSFKVENGVGTLVLNSMGKNRLQDIAKRMGLTKRVLVDRIMSGEVK